MPARESFVEWLASDPGRAALAGALGGVVRWLTLRHSWKEGVVTLLVGGICAMYLGPLALPLIEPLIAKVAPTGDASGLSSFLIGLGGISISGLLLDVFDRRRRDIKGGDDDA